VPSANGLNVTSENLLARLVVVTLHTSIIGQPYAAAIPDFRFQIPDSRFHIRDFGSQGVACPHIGFCLFNCRAKSLNANLGALFLSGTERQSALI